MKNNVQRTVWPKKWPMPRNCLNCGVLTHNAVGFILSDRDRDGWGELGDRVKGVESTSVPWCIECTANHFDADLVWKKIVEALS